MTINDLFDTVIRLRGGGVAEPGPRSGLADTAWPDEWALAAFHAASDQAVHPDVWERHPAGDEVLCMLSGAVNLYLREVDGGTEPAATLSAGQSLVIPAGRWHRLSVVEPGDLMAITPSAGTQHMPASEHQNIGED